MKKFTKNQINFQLSFYCSIINFIAGVVMLLFLLITYYKFYLPNFEKNREFIETQCHIINVGDTSLTLDYTISPTYPTNITGLQTESIYVSDTSRYNISWVKCYYNICKYIPLMQDYIDICTIENSIDYVRLKLYNDDLPGKLVGVVFVLYFSFLGLFMFCFIYMICLLSINEPYYIDNDGLVIV